MKANEMFRILMASLLAGALAFGLVACGDDDDDDAAATTSESTSEEGTSGEPGESGETDEPGESGTTEEGTESEPGESSVGELACDACIETLCADEQAACDAEPDCGGLLACAAECEDQDCVTACSGQYPAGIAVFFPLFTCIQNECPICLEDAGEDSAEESAGNEM